VQSYFLSKRVVAPTQVGDSMVLYFKNDRRVRLELLVDVGPEAAKAHHNVAYLQRLRNDTT